MTSPRTLLSAWNLHPKKQLGQNFLAEPSTARMIIERAGITPEDTVLEIGSGLGALTIPAAARAARIIAVETDRQIADLLKTELLAAGITNVTVLRDSIFNVNIETLAAGENQKIVALGNLPYNISSQILVQLIRARTVVSRAVVMFQKEFAERLVAAPGNKVYGRITVMLAYCAEVKTVATIKARMFHPRPKIDSEVIEIRFREKIEQPADDEAHLFQVIKAAFGKRRKTLKNALSLSQLGIDASSVEKALQAAAIDPVRRAETLTVEEFVRLSNTIGTRV
ncbi:MAG: 16S rRNA (adenine(1518)-N(6)/adenine(1519)-N(6))-dimethyltransferase RsmA [Desulfobacterales bacterium]|nr:16S rRNA (adenine(1518)-N(6)/adenine(1519)-N(6))-dimethyltransferase RsmA [Desulfobacterales bacterium]